jgi:UDP:flavonoid glycosyltransferase YjiC (YdhE family)
VYLTLGSSGSLPALRVALEALRSMDVDVLLATAGRVRLRSLPANVRAASLVRGDLAAQRARVVICSGGASTAYQALAVGTPVVGLPMNLDQYLAMDAIRRAGAGVLLRSGTATPGEVREAVLRAVGDSTMRAAARRVALATACTDANREFAAAVERLILPAQRLDGKYVPNQIS